MAIRSRSARVECGPPRRSSNSSRWSRPSSTRNEQVPRTVTAFSNSAVKAARALRDKKHRRREGRFLAEGLRIVTEAREAGALPETLFFAEGSEKRIADLIAATEDAGGEAIA